MTNIKKYVIIYYYEKEVILGIDISTSRIGIAAVTTDDQIFADTITFQSGHLKIERSCFKKKDLSLEDKGAHFFESLSQCSLGKIMQLQRLQWNPLAVFQLRHYLITDELSSLTAFAGGKTLTANTMAKLQRFNGMCCYAIHKSIFNQMIIQPSKKMKLTLKHESKKSCRSLNEIKIPTETGSNTN